MSVYFLKRYNANNFLSVQDKAAKKNNAYVFSSVKLCPSRDVKTNKILTNLTKEEQIKFEEELGLEVGELSPTSKYWDKYVITVPEGELMLDTSNYADKLTLKILQSIDTVAMSLEDAKKKPNVTFIVYNPDTEAEATVRKLDYMDDAVLAYKAMSINDIEDFIYYIQPFANIKTLSENRKREIVLKWRNEQPDKFVDIIGYNSNEKDDKLVKKASSQKRLFKNTVFVNKLVSLNVINLENGSFKDGVTGEIIATDKAELIKNLFNPANQKSLEKYKVKLEEVLKVNDSLAEV